jgi:hypothetical protein
MMTVRHIERLWTTRAYDRLLDELLANRPEAEFRRKLPASRGMVAAAMAMIRLDELSQTDAPVYRIMLQTILAAQESDGGWGDLVTTAWCLRALTLDQGRGTVVERGMDYLALLQRDEGLWPAIPIRRLPADPFVSAFILYQLGDIAQFRQRVRFDDAVNWFSVKTGARAGAKAGGPSHASGPQKVLTALADSCAILDEDCRALWDRALLRCRMRPAEALAPLAN